MTRFILMALLCAVSLSGQQVPKPEVTSLHGCFCPDCAGCDPPPPITGPIGIPNSWGCYVRLVGSSRYELHYWRVWTWRWRDGAKVTRILPGAWTRYSKASKACEKWMRTQQ